MRVEDVLRSHGVRVGKSEQIIADGFLDVGFMYGYSAKNVPPNFNHIYTQYYIPEVDKILLLSDDNAKKNIQLYDIKRNEITFTGSIMPSKYTGMYVYSEYILKNNKVYIAFGGSYPDVVGLYEVGFDELGQQAREIYVEDDNFRIKGFDETSQYYVIGMSKGQYNHKIVIMDKVTKEVTTHNYQQNITDIKVINDFVYILHKSISSGIATNRVSRFNVITGTDEITQTFFNQTELDSNYSYLIKYKNNLVLLGYASYILFLNPSTLSTKGSININMNVSVSRGHSAILDNIITGHHYDVGAFDLELFLQHRLQVVSSATTTSLPPHTRPVCSHENLSNKKRTAVFSIAKESSQTFMATYIKL